jgi:hypothetical protein
MFPSYRRLGTFTLNAWNPTITVPGGGPPYITYVPEGQFKRSFASEIQSAKYSLSSFGGYDGMGIQINDCQAVIDDWIANGLGRHIALYSPEGVGVWEGFVNEVKANLGTLSLQRGPLLDVSNYIQGTYTNHDTSVSPPYRSPTTYATPVSDSVSQGLFGYFLTTVQCGQVTSAQANQIVTMYLQEHAYPETTQKINVSSGSFNMTLTCLGYFHWFSTYTYVNNATGTVGISTQIQDIVNAQPNSVISTDFLNIATNAFAIPDGAYSEQEALGLLKNLVQLGDNSNNRYVVGVYDGQVLYYEVAPARTSVEYLQYLSDVGQRVRNKYGKPLPLWDIRPGKWLKTVDLLPGQVSEGTSDDPTFLFIEKIDYSIPASVSITASKHSQVRQQLNRLGLGGTYA